MSLPTYQDAMLPMVRALEDGNERHIRDLTEMLIREFGLSESERQELLPSGQSTVIGNRIGWARTYLSKSGLIEKASTRGRYKITERGLDVLRRNPGRIDNDLLSEFPEFTGWLNLKRDQPTAVPTDNRWEQTPEESLETAHQTLRVNLATEVLEKVKTCSPAFFERLVVELLVKMGYGGTREDAGQAVGRSGDGGIDGIIKEDRLGLDVIYLQAKRWENTVGSPEIQKFAGALQGRRATKGVFITTSDYSKGAREFAGAINNKIILIDGDELADLMIDYNVGVSIFATYETKKIDSDYFIEE